MSLRCAILVFIGKSLPRLISWAVFCLILSWSNKETTSIGKFCSTMLPVFRVIHPALMPIYLVHETEIVLVVTAPFFAIIVEYTSRESPSVCFVWESRASCSIWGVSISCAMNCFGPQYCNTTFDVMSMNCPSTARYYCEIHHAFQLRVGDSRGFQNWGWRPGAIYIILKAPARLTFPFQCCAT